MMKYVRNHIKEAWQSEKREFLPLYTLHHGSVDNQVGSTVKRENFFI